MFIVKLEHCIKPQVFHMESQNSMIFFPINIIFYDHSHFLPQDPTTAVQKTLSKHPIYKCRDLGVEELDLGLG